MNQITLNTPINETIALLHKDGYVVLENALNAVQLKAISLAYDEQLNRTPVELDTARIEIKRILEQNPVFEQLMDLPTVFPIARQMIGADIELASSGELDHKFARTSSHIGWHNDFQWMTNVHYPRQNFWIRTTYFLSDVTEDMGPFTLLPGTHLAKNACPSEYNIDGKPLTMDGQIRITGKAGSCLINNTEIWHTNTSNTSDFDRRLIMILYKHAWMKQWQEGYDTTAEFAKRQTDPIRQQLCGRIPWHHGEKYFPAASIGK